MFLIISLFPSPRRHLYYISLASSKKWRCDNGGNKRSMLRLRYTVALSAAIKNNTYTYIEYMGMERNREHPGDGYRPPRTPPEPLISYGFGGSGGVRRGR